MVQPCQAFRHVLILNSSTEVNETTHMTARHWAGVTPMDALCLMIKNNSYLGAGKAFAQACCLLVSSLNVLLISTQAPYEIFGGYVFSRYPSTFLLNWMWMPRQLYVPFSTQMLCCCMSIVLSGRFHKSWKYKVHLLWPSLCFLFSFCCGWNRVFWCLISMNFIFLNWFAGFSAAFNSLPNSLISAIFILFI